MDMKAFEEKVGLCLQKLNREIDLDWSEIVEILGLNCSADHLRKLAYAYKEYHEYIQSKGLDSVAKEMQQKLNEQLVEIKKQKVQLSDLRAEVNRQARYQARFEQLLETAKYCCDKANEVKPFYDYEVVLPDESEITRDGVLLLSDLHYGQEVDNHWNSYNKMEFEKRCNILVDRVLDICKRHEVKTVHIMGLGDYMNGLIHTTTRLSNRESLVEQVLNVSEAISTIVYSIASEVPHVTLSMTDDNHSRIFANKKENTDKDSFVPFMKEFVKGRINKLPNVTFIDNYIDDGITLLNVCNCTVVGVHGDKDKISSVIPNLTSMLKTNIDYVCMAHYHNCKEDTFGESELIVNGSFGGTDDYAKNLRLHSKPMQKFMIFSRPYGRECTYNIDVRGVK